MAGETKRVTIEIVADDKGAIQAFKNVGGVLDDLGTKARASGGVLADLGTKARDSGGFFAEMKSWMTPVNQGLELLSKAANVTTAALDALFSGVERGASFDDLSQKMGISVTTLSSLDLAAQKAGLSMADLALGVKGLLVNMVDAAGGGKEAQAAFAQLGVAATDASGRMRDTQDVLLDAADAFAGIEDGAQKTVLAMEIFSRAGMQMLPFLSEGRAGLEKWIDTNTKLGLTINGETARALDTVTDNWETLGRVTDGITQQLAVGLAPGLEAVTSGLVEMVAEAGIGDGTLRELGETIGGALVDALVSLQGSIEDAQTLIAEVGWDEAFRMMGDKMEAAAVSVIERVGKTLWQHTKDAIVGAIQQAMTGPDVSAALKSSNEDLLRDVLANQESLLKQAQLPGLDVHDTQQGSTVNALAANVDTLRDRLGELHGAELVAAADAAALGRAHDDAAVKTQLLELGVSGATAEFRFYEQGVGSGTRTLRTLGVASDDAAKAAKKLAEAYEQVAGPLEKSITSSKDYLDTLEAELAAGKPLAVAKADAAKASERAAYAADLEAKGLGGVEDALLALYDANERYLQSRREREAAAGYEEEIAALNEQRGIYEQIVTGQVTRQQGEHLISVELEKQKLLAAGFSQEYLATNGGIDAMAEKMVSARERTDEVRTAVSAIGEEGFNVADQLKDAFDQVLDGLIAGTLDWKDVWKSFATSAGKQLFDGIWDSKLKFDTGFKGNLLDLVGYAGDLFSGGSVDIGGLFSWGGSSAGGGGSGGGISGLFSSPWFGSGRYNTVSAGQFVGPLTEGGYQGTTGGVNWSASSAGIGLLSGIGGSALGRSMFWKGGTSLEGGAKGAESSIMANAEIIDTVIAAVLGALTGGALGGVAGLISSGVGAVLLGDIDRDTLRTKHLGGFHGVLQDFETMYGALPNWASPLGGLVELLGIPTLGTAYRRSGEGVLDASQTFGGEDGKGGLQGLLGDWTRTSHKTGIETAQERGLSDSQIDAIRGSTEIIFSDLFKDEKFPEDAGRLALEQGRGMAEFLSRGLAEGMDYSDMLASLNSLAGESGVTLQKAIEGLPQLSDQIAAQAEEFGGVDPTAAAKEGADAYARALWGIDAIFSQDLPAGVNIASVALQTMEKDGVKAAGELNDGMKDALVDMTEDAEDFQAVVSELVSQGFEIDTAEFKDTLRDIIDSATFVGDNIKGIFSYENLGAGIDAMAATLQDTITSTVQDSALTKLFDTTRIAESFQPVYALLNDVDAFDFSTASGAASFRDQMVTAIAEGKANLKDYLPQLEAIADATDLVDEAIEEAFEPGPIQKFYEDMAALTEAAAADIESAIGGAFKAAMDAEDLTAARATFSESLRADTYSAMLDGIVAAIMDGVVVDALADIMAEGSALWKAALTDGTVDAAEQAQLDDWATRFREAGDALASSLQPTLDYLYELFGPGGSLNADITITTREDHSVGSGSDSSSRRIIGAATGGRFRGSAIVGEAGSPELVTALPGGGFEVVPLSWDAASAMLGAGAAGFATGGRVDIGGGWTPGAGGTRGGTGGTGDTGSTGGSGTGRGGIGGGYAGGGYTYGGGAATFSVGEFEVKLDLSGAFDDLARSGDWAAFTDALDRDTRDAVMDGVVDALLDSSKIQGAIDNFTTYTADAVNAALKDGVIDASESDAIRALSERLAGDLSTSVDAVRPALDAMRDALGIVFEDSGSKAALSLDTAISNFAAGGTLDSLRSDLNSATYDAILIGVVDGLLAEGPIADAMDEFNDALSDLLAEGITDSTGAALGDLGVGLVGEVAPLIDALGPMFDGVLNRFATDTATDLSAVFSTAMSGAFADGQTYSDFGQSIKLDLYNNVKDGLVAAFFDSAIVQGALAPILDEITSIFDRVAAKQLSIAEANALILDQVGLIDGVLAGDDFKSMWDTTSDGLDQIASKLGIVTTSVTAATTAFDTATNALTDTASAAVRLEYDLAREQLGIGNLTEAGGAGVFGFEYYEPRKFAAGGLVRKSTFGLFGEAGPEVVLPLDSPETTRLLSDAAARMRDDGGRGETVDISELTSLFRDVREELRSLRAENRDLRATIAARPMTVEIEGKTVATAVVDHLERRSRSGTATLDRVR